MQVTRTANAGVLLELDGTKILLDGVSREVLSYPATPEAIKIQLSKMDFDLVAVTHCHEDHSDPAFEEEYERKSGKSVFRTVGTVQAGNVTVTAVATRHIGKVDCDHVSFVIEGSRCIWFTGDASPSQFKGMNLPKPDVLICPFAFATTESAWRLTQEFGVKTVILLHLPEREKDSFGLWQAVETVISGCDFPKVYIPKMGERIAVNPW